ncbi:hypothetical protein [Streptomyces candidus]|uniref:Uncharacterized protein n=1 Tax=Streptomyces candidus TaxID=67283 RepID=A0A7X0LU41_9ACTN|nr:hypothetical protein [Streptomyces candidus]MBB6440054.1 hypothetical protein [Streptomyces candidus]GHH56220.1 hypothetical protein GCM10018773_61890 [Streptomyces candidus]
MTITDPDQIPATPIYTITVSSNGIAAVNGEEVTEPGLDAAEARVRALAEVRIKAAFHGRPVRVLAKEADGAAWPLIVDVNGDVVTLNRPHPTPPSPAQASPATPSSPAAAEPGMTLAETPAARRTRAEPQPAAPDAGRATAAVPPEWAAPLPPQYASAWAELVAHEKAGRLVEAIVAAAQLETALSGAVGPLAPPTVNVMTTRAAFTVRRVEESEDWAETMELLVQTAQRRREAGAPEDETQRVISNAHAAWFRLAVEDPEYARETAEPVLVLLGDQPEHKHRAQAVIRILERGAAA